MILFQKFIFSDDLDYFHLKLSSKFGLLFGDYTDTDSDCDSEPIKWYERFWYFVPDKVQILTIVFKKGENL